MSIRTPLRRRHGTRYALAVLVTVAGIAAGCGGASRGDGDELTVVAAFYPLQFAAERVAGNRAEVTNLVKPGAEPHDLELTPRQVAQVADADLVVYLKGFQPAVDEAVAQYAADRAFDVAAVTPHHGATDGDSHDDGGKDPHIWLDPTLLATVTDQLGERLGKVAPEFRDTFRDRAAALRRDLEKLDEEYRQGLANCQRREIFVSHAAFGYLAARYKLEQIALSGLSPDQEPTADRLAAVAREARKRGATVIFFETLVSPEVARTLAHEVGAQAKVLDPIEGIKPGTKEDYLSVMRTNLQTLRPALGCS